MDIFSTKPFSNVGKTNLEWMHPSNPLTHPFSQICAINLRQTPSKYTHLGSGFLLAPNLVLTAAHVVDLGQAKENTDGLIKLEGGGLYIILGLNRGSSLGKSMISHLILYNTYNNAGDSGDMAIAVLQSSQKQFKATPPIPWSDGYDEVNYAQVAGYPYYDGITADGKNLMIGRGPLMQTEFENEAIYYKIDTLGGHSGSPVFVEQGNQNSLSWIGIHVADSLTAKMDANKGLRFLPEHIEWMKAIVSNFYQD